MINQEEYEILKGLDDKWKWIVRDGVGNKINVYSERPIKSAFKKWWLTSKWLGARATVSSDLFRFIQWEDEEPYRISDLIKEYEDRGDIGYTSKEYAEHLSKFNEKLLTKMEEEKMKKDKEWLKDELVQSYLKESEIYLDGKEFQKARYFEISEKKLFNLIDQLDEPEVLSQEWIDEHSNGASRSQYVWVDDLKDLLVPKQEVTEEQVMHWIDNNEFYDHATAETVLANAVDKGELGYYGTKYSLVEKPVIPKFVAEYLEFAKSNAPLMRVLEIASRRDEEPECEKEYDWISYNAETFARAWLDGYTMEEEQKYHVTDENDTLLCKSNGVVMTVGKLWAIGNEHEAEYDLTEQEIKDYDERFWAFAAPVEEVEDER